MASSIFTSILKEYWGYDDFRGIQLDIIQSIYDGHDTLGLMPTGGGKSITFQVPALAQEGICIVISPLIALMKDQVQNLRNRGIKAAAIYTGLSHQDVIVTLENCIFGNYKFLYISPERLKSDIFITKLRHMKISFVTVDEAHCISQWGYDFRPSYLHISEIRKILPEVPILALTATATPLVVSDIQKQLGFSHENVFRMSFMRKNLAYIVRHVDYKREELFSCLNHIQGSTIIYCRNRRECRELSEELNNEGFTATFYHAGLTNSERDERQRSWLNDEIRIMVATNAFGMGIDKPDVRLVLHLEIPDSLEAYFQEAGRAGRDGEDAYAILLYSPRDRKKMLQRIPATYPDVDKIKEIYEHLCYYYQLAVGDGHGMTRELNLGEFCANFNHFPLHAHNALCLLSQAGYIEYIDDEETKSRLRFLIHRDEMYSATRLDSELQDNLIRVILRAYAGLFADYRIIDEDELAKAINQKPHVVYNILKGLSKRHIVDYIPRKRTSYISFTMQRVDTEKITLERALYNERKSHYKERIQSVIDYAEEEETCRSAYVLRYFGEETPEDCGKCDVCTYMSDHYPTRSQKKNITESLFQQIKSNPLKAIFPTEIIYEPYLMSHVKATLQELVDEDIILLTPQGKFYIGEERNPY